MISDERLKQLAEAYEQLTQWQRETSGIYWPEVIDMATELLSLREQVVRMREVVEAAKCIRHWHDASNGGMIVSGEHVRALWESLAALEPKP